MIYFRILSWSNLKVERRQTCKRKKIASAKMHIKWKKNARFIIIYQHMLKRQCFRNKNFASLWWFSAYATRCSAIITGIEDNKEPLESRVRKQQKTSKDEDLDCWTILSESTLLVSASFGDWTICSGWFRCCFDGRKHRPPTLGHFLQMSWRLLMASSTPTAFRHEWISLVFQSTKKRNKESKKQYDQKTIRVIRNFDDWWLTFFWSKEKL